ncbi:MAG: molybdopterin oxidoreductase family protein, partial [Planctomycetota bacterium]
LYDRQYIDGFTENWPEMKAHLADFTPEKMAPICGIEADVLRAVARDFATAKAGMIFWGMGISQHIHGTDNSRCLISLALMCGHVGRPGAGLHPLRGQNNVQGANDSGATPIFLPGYQRVDDPEVNAKYEAAWGTTIPSDPGLNLNVMMKEVGKSIKGLFVMGEDVVLSEPNCIELEKGMNAAEFVVVQDAFLNETCRFADVVFPASVFAEKEGVFTNSERRVQRVRKAVEPPGEAREDWRILIDLANASGADWSFDSPAEVYDELARDADKFAGISHARLDATVELPKTGLQWPCPSPEHPGTTFLHEEGILRGKGLFQAVDYRPPAELPDEQYGLLLSTGRTLYHYNCATQTRRESGLDAKQSEAWVEMHPRDAKRRGIEDRDMVEVTTRRGSVQVRALYSRQVQPRCIWMPLHFFEARANVITNDAGDPVTDTAEYKICAAEVRKVEDGEAREGLFPGTFYGVDAPA